MQAQNLSTNERSLFCQCNYTPCRCWPSAPAAAPAATRPRTQSRSRPRTQSRLQPPSSEVSWPHYSAAQQLPSPRTPSRSHSKSGTSPSVRGYTPAYVEESHRPSPSTTSTRSIPNHPQLHGLLKAQSILRTPESPSALRLEWDVRDSATEALVLSGHEPERLFEHPSSLAYATSPPVPFMLIVCSDTLPWMAPVYAQKGCTGVTVRDVLQAVHDVLHRSVEESMVQQLPTDQDRSILYQTYHERVARTGDDRRGILAVDTLGGKSSFVCIGRDEAMAKRRVADKDLWPHVYALKLRLRNGTLVSDA